MKMSLRRHHALIVEDVPFSHKIDYIPFVLEIFNLEGNSNSITGLRVTLILLNGMILPISGALAVEGVLSTGLPCLVSVLSYCSFTAADLGIFVCSYMFSKV